MCLEILLRSKCPCSTRLISQKVQPEAINDVDNLLCALLERLLVFFGRGVGANVDVVNAQCDLPAVDFVDDVVDFFEGIGVGDDFVAGYDVL